MTLKEVTVDAGYGVDDDDDFDEIVKMSERRNIDETNRDLLELELTEAGDVYFRDGSLRNEEIREMASLEHAYGLREYGEDTWMREQFERPEERSRSPKNFSSPENISTNQATDMKAALLQQRGERAVRFSPTSADVENTSSPSSLVHYVMELILHLNDAESTRGKQARLTLGELSEHFDFFNDFLFICRIGWTTMTQSTAENEHMGYIAFVCMTCIWVISAAAYSLRSSIIYHRIKGDDLHLFYPFIVFAKIRSVGDQSPEVLYMFERLFWTYQLVMRLVEDIPQVICSALFLASFGKDLYTYFMISYSCLLMLLTSFRMGVMYPIFGTVSLLLSREPPIDSPVLTEAATTTKNFSGFMFFNFALWTMANLTCLVFVSGMWFISFCTLSIVSTLLAIFFLSYWLYLLKQSGTNPEEQNFQRLHTALEGFHGLPHTPRLDPI